MMPQDLANKIGKAAKGAAVRIVISGGPSSMDEPAADDTGETKAQKAQDQLCCPKCGFEGPEEAFTYQGE